MAPFRIGFVLFPRLTQLDLTGPYEILSRMRDTETLLLAKVGVNAVLGDAEILGFLQKTAEHARYVTAVCTGSLALGAAGLLRGRRAACHWLSREALRKFGAEPTGERVTIDGNIITGGGVTAGIDFALRVVEQLRGKAAAEAIQLMVEYDPHPPFDAGSPERAGPELVERIRRAAEPMLRERDAAVARAAKVLEEIKP